MPRSAFDAALIGLGLTLDQLVANQTLLKTILDVSNEALLKHMM